MAAGVEIMVAVLAALEPVAVTTASDPPNGDCEEREKECVKLRYLLL